jgi:aminomethyltransferase
MASLAMESAGRISAWLGCQPANQGTNMPIPTPFHSRTAALSQSQEWRNWSGYLAAGLYEAHHEREYYAIRNSAALIDVTPLFKYEISGPDALNLVNRIMTRDISRCAVGQVMYSPWCDDDGKVIDDGTISRLEADRFRITAADPNLAWFQDCGCGMQAAVTDVSGDLAALAIQGPNAREILKEILQAINLDSLRYYHRSQAKAGEFSLTVTRTGYTGDLGYELWVEAGHAEKLWDLLVEKGWGYGLLPAGMVALDIARIEAGLLLIEVDYISSRKALIPAQKSSPFEIGLEWAVSLDKEDFVGRQALLAEKKAVPKWKFVGLEVDWTSLEALYNQVGLAVQVAGRASRSAVPIYKNGIQIGQATSQTFSPILKKYIALGTVEARQSVLGRQVSVEVTVEYTRLQARAAIVKTPFYNPPWKRA